MTGIRANSVQVDKLFRARCHLTPCGWMGTEYQSFADANAERHAHLLRHELALDDTGPEVTGFPVIPAGQIAAEVAADVRRLTSPPRVCGRCKSKPVALPAAAPADGDRAQFCDWCIDRCHEATEFDHICQVCASPEEARARGWAVTR